MQMCQTDLLLLSTGPPPMPWANNSSSAHELEGVISVKPTQTVIA